MKCNIMPNIGMTNLSKPEPDPLFKSNGVEFVPIDYDIESEEDYFRDLPNGRRILWKKVNVIASIFIDLIEYEKISLEFWKDNIAYHVQRLSDAKHVTRKNKKMLYDFGVRIGMLTFREINDIKVNRYKYRNPTGNMIIINDHSFCIMSRNLSIHEDYSPHEQIRILAKMIRK